MLMRLLALLALFSCLIVSCFAHERSLDLQPKRLDAPVPGGQIVHLTADKSLIFVAAGNSRSNLLVLQPRNGAAEIIGGVFLPGFASHVSVRGNYAYVTAQADGLHVVNISNPAAPALARSFDTPGSALRSTVVSNALYVADGSGVIPFDISDPANPVQGARLAIGGAVDVAVRDQHGYVTGGTGLRLHILDLSQPLAPAFVRTINLGGAGGSDDIELSGKYAFVTAREGGLAVFDLSVPGEPSLVSTVNDSLNPVSVQLSGGYAFVSKSSSPGGATVYDVSNPAAPRIAAQLHSTESFGSGTIGIAVASPYAYFTLDNSLPTWRSVKWAPATPQTLGEIEFPNVLMASVNIGLSNILVGAPRLLEINADDPSRPVIIRTNIDAFIQPFALSADFAAGVVGSTFQTYTRLPDDTLELAGGVEILTSGISTRRIAIKDHYAYLAHGTQRLQIFDVLDLQNPRLIGVLSNWVDVRDVSVDAELMAIIGNNSPVLLDISDPAEPSVAGQIVDPHAVTTALALRNGRLYAAMRVGNAPQQVHELRTYDVTSPAQPTLIGTAPLRARAERIALHRGRAFIAQGSNGFEMFDVTNPATPARVGGSGVITSDFAFRPPHFYTIGRSFAVHQLPEPSAFQIAGVQIDAAAGDVVVQVNAPPGLLEIFSSADLSEWSSFKTLQSATGSYELRAPLDQSRLFLRAMTR